MAFEKDSSLFDQFLGILLLLEGDKAEIFSLIFGLVEGLFDVGDGPELTEERFDLVVGDLSLEFPHVDFTRTSLSFFDGHLLFLDVVGGVGGGSF